MGDRCYRFVVVSVPGHLSIWAGYTGLRLCSLPEMSYTNPALHSPRSRCEVRAMVVTAGDACHCTILTRIMAFHDRRG